MKSKKTSMIIGIAVIITALGLAALLAGMKTPPEKKEKINRPLLVSTQHVENKRIQSRVPVIGSLAARNKIEIYSEVSGVLQKTPKPFLEGISFKKGSTLISVDSREIRSALKSKKSQLMNQLVQVLPDLKFDYPQSFKNMEAFLRQLKLDKKMPPLPTPGSEREKYFLAARNIYQTYYDISGLEVKLSKYTISAPFTGVITESYIKPGTLVRAGQKLGEFIDTRVYDMETHIKVDELPLVTVGDTVPLVSGSIPGQWTGTVNRIANRIDGKTQTLTLFISVTGPSLKEGMYLKGEIMGKTFQYGTEIPRKLLRQGNRVWIVKDAKAQLTPVDILQYHGDRVIISGLDNGTHLALKTGSLSQGLPVRTQ